VSEFIHDVAPEDLFPVLTDYLSGVSVFLLDPERRVSSWNAGAERLWGYSSDEIVGRPFSLMGGSNAVQEEGWRVRKDGSTFWARIVIARLPDSGFAVLTRDMTELKEAEDKLRRSESRLAESQQLAHLGSWEWDIAADRVTWTDELFRIFGLPPGSIQVTYQEYLKRVHPEDRDHAQAIVGRALAERSTFASEYRIVRQDGAVRVFQTRGQVLVDAEQKPIRMYGVCQDVTELHQAQSALRESEERYRRIVETAEEGIWTLDAEGRTVFVNQKMAEMMRCRLEDMIGRSLFSFMDDQGRAIAEKNLARRQQGIREQHDFKFVRPDGTEFWAIVSASPIMDSSGRYVGALGMITDISDRKKREEQSQLLAQEKVRREEAERAQIRSAFLAEAGTLLDASLDYSATLSQVAKLVVSSMADWCTVYVQENNAVRRIVVEHSDPSKVQWAEEIEKRYPYDPESPKGIAAVLRGGKPELYKSIPDELLRSRARDEEHLRLLRQVGLRSAMVVPMRARGKVIGAIALILSESEASYDEEDLALAQSLADRAALAIENSRLYHEATIAHRKATFLAEATAVLNSSLDYESTLATVARLAIPFLADGCAFDLVTPTGIRRVAVETSDKSQETFLKEIFGRYPIVDRPFSVRGVISTGKSVLLSQITDELLASVAVDPEHLELMKKNRSESFMAVPLFARGSVIGSIGFWTRQSGRRYTPADLGFAEELASRVAMAVDNATLYLEAKNAIRTREQFLSIASHELKTPLTGIQLQLQSLLRAAKKDTLSADRIIRSIESVERQGDRLAKLIDILLDVSRISSGKLSLKQEPVDLVEIVRAVADRFAEELKTKGISLGLEANGAAPSLADRLRLEQVVTNLLSNAIKFGKGRPISVSVRRNGTAHVITVRDQGIGMDAAARGRLFHPFEQAGAPASVGGLGLGLYISRQIIEAHGGSIEVESVPNEGSTFSVTLPAVG
jgi:PAS domain S-box-containing protein